jgi:cysteine-rich repeat protein
VDDFYISMHSRLHTVIGLGLGGMLAVGIMTITDIKRADRKSPPPAPGFSKLELPSRFPHALLARAGIVRQINVFTADEVRNGVQINSYEHNVFRCPEDSSPVPISSSINTRNNTAWTWIYEYSGNEEENVSAGKSGRAAWDGKYFISESILHEGPVEAAAWNTLDNLSSGEWYYILSEVPLTIDCRQQIRPLHPPATDCDLSPTTNTCFDSCLSRYCNNGVNSTIAEKRCVHACVDTQDTCEGRQPKCSPVSCCNGRWMCATGCIEDEERPDIALISLSINPSPVLVGQTVTVNILLRNNTNQSYIDVPIVIHDQRGWGNEIEVTIPSNTEREFSLPLITTELLATYNPHSLTILIGNRIKTTSTIMVNRPQDEPADRPDVCPISDGTCVSNCISRMCDSGTPPGNAGPICEKQCSDAIGNNCANDPPFCTEGVSPVCEIGIWNCPNFGCDSGVCDPDAIDTNSRDIAFELMDSNGDGSLTIVEVIPVIKELFSTINSGGYRKRFDLNNDGLVVPGDAIIFVNLTNELLPMQVRTFAFIDINKDYILTRQEVKYASDLIFTAIGAHDNNPELDINKDGFVSPIDALIPINIANEFGVCFDNTCKETSSSSSIASTSSECGNDIKEGLEECDDGNDRNFDSCPNDCKRAVCGDGVREGYEECDDGNRNSTDSCSNTCTVLSVSGCGNKIIEIGENCDDGNRNNFDSCPNDCTRAVCGDGMREGGEECDDGNRINFDACQNSCKAKPVDPCGNGTLDVGEACDDGNTKDGDGCTSECLESIAPSSMEWKEVGESPPSSDPNIHGYRNTEITVFKGKMWLIGGSRGSHVSGITDFVYSSTDGRNWTLAGHLPRKLRYHKAIVFNDKIWVIGGKDESGHYSSDVFSSSNGSSWNRIGSLPVGLMNHSITVYNGKIWIFGGSVPPASGRLLDAGIKSGKIFSSNNGSQWQEVGNDALPPTGKWGENSVIVHNGKMWFVGNSVYSSIDGITWQKEGKALFSRVFNRYPIVGKKYLLSFRGKLWMIGASLNGQGYPPRTVSVSEDGIHWERVTGSDVLHYGYERSQASVVFDNRMWLLGENFNSDVILAWPPPDNIADGDSDFDDLKTARERMAGWGDRAELSQTSDGRYIAYTTVERGVSNNLHRIDTQTMQRIDISPVSGVVGGYGQPTISSDGRYITAFQHTGRGTPAGTIWLIDVSTGNRTRIASMSEQQGSSGWEVTMSRDGNSIVFMSIRNDLDNDPQTVYHNRDGSSEIFLWKKSTGVITQITNLPNIYPPVFFWSDVRFTDNRGTGILFEGSYDHVNMQPFPASGHSRPRAAFLYNVSTKVFTRR